LLLIRDPLALWLLFKVFYQGRFPMNPYIIGTLLVGIIGIYMSTLLGHGNLAVALYGARILLLHFPLMFVIGQVIDREDVIKMGKVTLLIAIPMTVLTALQFYSPQSAWVNRGIGGDVAGAGFSGANGYFRPPGTFSFTNGLGLFYGFLAAFIFYFWVNTKEINKLILFASSIALFIAIPLSISRGLFFQVSVALVFLTVAIASKPSSLLKLFAICTAILLPMILISQTLFFQIATEAFTARFETANEIEGGVEGVLVDRYLGGMIGAITSEEKVPLFGFGLGMGTNVGSQLLTGSRTFLISEGEWGRLIGELGPILGLVIILIRLGFSIRVFSTSYKRMVSGDVLPWMLLSFGLLIIPQGQWAQPTSLGFSTLIGGLILASIRKPNF
jgi:hypothetical protein